MNQALDMRERPEAEELYMVAGWEQWADAGSVSSALPRSLIEKTQARKIGAIRSQGFYIFQVPGTHHFLRPEVQLRDGYPQKITARENAFYYTGDERRGLVIFSGEEPQVNVEGYADAFLDAVQMLGIKRVIAVGGVFGPVPFDKDRQVSCVYSLREMKSDLEQYAVSFSNYEGGVSIGTFLANQAGPRGIEFAAFYSLVPSYDFSQIDSGYQGIQIENDFRAWHELMRRLNVMFGLDIDLIDLQRQAGEITAAMEQRIAELEREAPALNVRQVLAQAEGDFVEQRFRPLDDLWERELPDLFKD